MFQNSVNKIIAFGIILLSLLNLCSCKAVEIDVHIFSNIEECQNIENLKADTADVKIYDSAAEDKYLKKLEFEEFFGCEYTSDDFSFELFAYEFSSDNFSMEYFENLTGKKNNPNPTFSDSSGMIYYERIVVSENRAYSVRCKPVDKEKVIVFLNEWFSAEVFSTAHSSLTNH